MKVTILAPVHPWDDVRIFHKQALSLSESGFEVSVIAKSEKARDYSNIKIIPANSSYVTRAHRFLSIPRIALQALDHKADIYHLHNPDTIPIAILLKLLGKKVIYDTHEDFSQRILAREWIPLKYRKVIAKAVSSLEILTARLCDGSIATQQDVVERLGDKCLLLGNSPRVNDSLIAGVKNIAEQMPRQDFDLFRLIYIGGIAESRGVFEMIDSLETINQKVNCRLWLIGPISDELLSRIQNLPGWKFVDFIHRIPQEEAFAYLYLSDVGLIYLKDIADHRKSDANKIYEYMTFGKPFIASNFPLWVNKLGSIDAGVFIEPDSSYKLAEAVTKLYDMPKADRKAMGKRGIAYTKDNSWEKDFNKLLKMYKRILNIK